MVQEAFCGQHNIVMICGIWNDFIFPMGLRSKVKSKFMSVWFQWTKGILVWNLQLIKMPKYVSVCTISIKPFRASACTIIQMLFIEPLCTNPRSTTRFSSQSGIFYLLHYHHFMNPLASMFSSISTTLSSIIYFISPMVVIEYGLGGY